MSNLKKRPGIVVSGTECDCDVTAYWFVRTVFLEGLNDFCRAGSEDGGRVGLLERVYTVGTMER